MDQIICPLTKILQKYLGVMLQLEETLRLFFKTDQRIVVESLHIINFNKTCFILKREKYNSVDFEWQNDSI